MESAVSTLDRELSENRTGGSFTGSQDTGASRTGRNPFLAGIYAPMEEELTLTELTVIGAIPPGLDGRYLRIGPNPIDVDPDAYHWFTGDGMVHGLALREGRALWYRNRWIRSNAVAAALGSEPAPGPHRHGDTVNTNVVDIGGRTFALIEAGSYPVVLGETLDEQRYEPFGGSLHGSFSAHPHLDQRTGESHAICYEGSEPGTIRHVMIDAAGRVQREEPIDLAHGPMIHDCAITDRFVVILDLPVTFATSASMDGGGLPYRWDPTHQSRVGLLPRNGSQDDIVWCAVSPGYVFHVANAYDAEDGRVVLDLCAYETMFDTSAQGQDVRSRGLERWTIDPESRMVDICTLDKDAQEFPRPDERFFGQRHRFVWSVATATERCERFVGATKLYAHDLVAGGRQIHDFGPGRHPGEFVFVAEEPDSPEGHGWLIGFVVDMNRDATELVILDARRFQEEPVARIHLPHRVPAGFHGNWISAAGAQ